MSCSGRDFSRDLTVNDNDCTEEGEIIDDSFELGLSYDTITSSSLIAPNSFNKRSHFSSNEFYCPTNFATEELRNLENSHKRSKRKKYRTSKDIPSRSHHKSSDRNKKTILNHTKDSNVINEFRTSNSCDKNHDVIFISDDDRLTLGYVSTRRGSTQEKENSVSQRCSKSLEDEYNFSKKKFKHKKYPKYSSDHNVQDSSGSRRKSSKPQKYTNKDRMNKQLHTRSDTLNPYAGSSMLHSHSSLQGAKSSSHKLKSKYTRQKTSNKDSPEIISFENLVRFKDNTLMRKLLESGTIRKKKLQSYGSDLNCEVGSTSSVSSPEFGLFEDIHLNGEDSLDSNRGAVCEDNTKVDNIISSDSEIEVIIPEKKIPELIELNSDSDSEQINVAESAFPNQTSQCSSSVKECEPDVPDNNVVDLDSPQFLEEINVPEEVQVPVEIGSNSENQQDVNETLLQPDVTEKEDEEVLQLRLVALRSAVLKKHIGRVQKRRLVKSNSVDKSSGQADDANVIDEQQILDCVNSPLDSAYCPSDRTSPLSPTNSSGFSLRGDEDNDIQELDMEIAATDEDENSIQESNKNIKGFNINFESDNASSRVLGMECHTSETLDLNPASDSCCNYNEVPPQPLPPGVDISNLPPEFTHSVSVCPENVYNSYLGDLYLQPPPPPPLTDSNSISDTLLPDHNHIDLIDNCLQNNYNKSPVLDTIVESTNKSGEIMNIDSRDSNGNSRPFSDCEIMRSVEKLDDGNDNRNSDDVDSNHETTCITNEREVSKEFHDSSFVENNDHFKFNYETENIKDDFQIAEANEETCPNKTLSSPNLNEVEIYSKEDSCSLERSDDKVDHLQSDSHSYTNMEVSNDCYQSSELKQLDICSENDAFIIQSICMDECSLPCESSTIKENGPNIESDQLESVKSSDYSRHNDEPQNVLSLPEKSYLSNGIEDEEDEDALRAELLNSLGSIRMKSSTSDPISVNKADVSRPKFKPKVSKKRTFGVRTVKQAIISPSLSDGDSSHVPFNVRKTKSVKENLQITLTDKGQNRKMKKPVISKRRKVIPVNSVVGNSNSKFIIKVGEDSDSGEDNLHSKEISISNTGIDKSNHKIKGISVRDEVQVLTPDLEKSVDLLLKQVREKHETRAARDKYARLLLQKRLNESSSPSAKTAQLSEKHDNLTPLAVRHLPKSQQEEYRRLKQQILEKERLKQHKITLQAQHPKSTTLRSQNSSLSNNRLSSDLENQQLCDEKVGEKISPKKSVDNNTESNHNKYITSTISTQTSDEDKSRELLSNAETQLINERFTLLDTLADMDTSLNGMALQIEEYNSSFKEVSRLKEELKLAEKNLETHSKTFLNLKSSIGGKYKKLLECRMECTRFSKACKELGGQVIGTSYILPKCVEELIKRRSQEIAKKKDKYLINLTHNKKLTGIVDLKFLNLPSPPVNGDGKENEQTKDYNEGNEKGHSKRNLDDSAEEVQNTKRVKQDSNSNDSIVNVESNAESSTLSRLAENTVLDYISPLYHLSGDGVSRSESFKEQTIT